MKTFTLSFILFLFFLPGITTEMLAVGTVEKTNIVVEKTSFGDQVKSIFKTTKSQLQDKVQSLKKWAKAKSAAMKDTIKRWKNLWIWGWILGGLLLVVGTILSFVSVGIGSGVALGISAGIIILGSLGLFAGSVGLVVFLIKSSE